MIDVTPSDYLKLHKGLVRMLIAIERAGPTGLSTRAISRQRGWRTLIAAEKAGYIERKTVIKPKGHGGNHYVMNYITAAGSQLLRELGE